MGPSSPADGAEFSGGRVLRGAEFSGADFSVGPTSPDTAVIGQNSRWGNLRRRRPAIIDNSRPWGLVLSAILDPDREHFVFEKKYLFHLENSNKTKLMQLKMFETNTSIVNNKKKYMQYI